MPWHPPVKSPVWPGAAQQAKTGVCAAVVGMGDLAQHPPRLQLEGPQLWDIVPTCLPGAWCSWWDQGWQCSNWGCSGEVSTHSQVHLLPSLLPGENF